MNQTIGERHAQRLKGHIIHRTLRTLMGDSSEISKIYSQYQSSLTTSQEQFNSQLKEFAVFLRKRYDDLIKEHVRLFRPIFENQIERLEIKRCAENFFKTTDIEFVAIDGSCHKHSSSNFVSFYGGAYGSKGVISLAGPSGIIKYHRWEFNKDVSMVAFVPIPPEMMTTTIDEETLESSEAPPVLSDGEISEVSSMHTKIMQLAEVYLAYTVAQSSVQMPRIILIDNTLCGILANSSFSPNSVRLQYGDFDGETLTKADMHVALAHPLNKELNIPSTKNFQPHFRVIAETVWKESKSIKLSECSGVPQKNFDFGASFLERQSAGSFNKNDHSFTFFDDPRTSWKKSLRIFENMCEKIFREKQSNALTYKLQGESRREYFLPRDIQFLIGVGIRALIEICWKRKILLIGVVKDSFSRYFYRNYLGTLALLSNNKIDSHLRLPLTDRTIVETLPNIVKELQSPWATLEYDSCFMTLHPDKKGEKWQIMGYPHHALGETTRPERIFLRSLAQFFMTEDKSLAAHALFLDRLAYPDWDDKDSTELKLPTESFGEIKPLYYDSKNKHSRLQNLSMYLLSVLVRNHFPEALGYPDPLHEADWGAKSLKRRVIGLLDSSEWVYRANPRERTFREIRESYGR